MTRRYTRPSKDESDEEFVTRFVAEFQHTGLLKIKAELDASPGKTLKETMVVSGEWAHYEKTVKDDGRDPEVAVLGLEVKARAIK